MVVGLLASVRRFAFAIATCAFLLAASQPAAALTSGTDCGCSLTGEYIAPDPGVEPPLASAATGLSPGGRYRIVITSLANQTPATLDVVRVADGVVLLHNVTGLEWGFSPDDDRFVIGFFTGTAPNQQFEWSLYDLAGGMPAPKIWSNGPAPWNSSRFRFSKDGKVFLFAGYHPTPGVHVALLEVASRSLWETSFFPKTAPGNVDDDADPSVAGWGFGPDPTRFVYAYVANIGAGLTQWGRVNVDTRVGKEDSFTADSMFGVFSPCGDTIALVVKQLALSDITDVYLYGTLNPLAAQLGTQSLPHSALLVQSTATEHDVLQAGVANELAPNHAADVCPVNAPPDAAFTPPSGVHAGVATTFTDQSTDDGQVVAWHWDFGDGATSSARNPSHTYAAGGTYSVSLTVTDDQGLQGTVAHDVQVCGTLPALSGRLLFMQLGTGITQDLWILNADDATQVRLTDSEAGGSQPQNARFSPDATKIAYADTGLFVGGIWTMNADGSHRQRLTDGGGSHELSAYHDNPAWSPDGQWIVFTNGDVETPANQGLWMVRADGSAPAKIPSTQLFDRGPIFAPELAPGCVALPAVQRTPGCYSILFERNEPGSNLLSRIYSISGAGNGPVATTPAGGFEMVRLSPDGDTFALTRFLGLTGPLGGVHRIFTRARTAGTENQITQGGDDNFYNPVWSPNGDAVAYAFSVNGVPGRITNEDVGVTEPTGCDAQTLLSGPAMQTPLDWAPGHAVQGLGSIQGEVQLDTNALTNVAGAVVEMSGDASGTTTTDASGAYRFENIPIGANVTIRFVSAPGYVAYPYATAQVNALVGHAVNVEVTAAVAQAHLSGHVRDAASQPVAGVTVVAAGPGGPFQTVTDATGAYAMDVTNYASLVVTPSKPGLAFTPPSASVLLQNGTTIANFTSKPGPPPGRIAFVSDRTGDDDIWLVDADGGNAVDVVQEDGSQRDPAWAPDARRVAYASDQDGGGFALWVYDLQTGTATSLGIAGREPAWSPDAKQLVFATDTGLRLLTLADGSTADLTSDASDASPAWRSDTDMIVFERDAGDGTTDLEQIEPTPGATPTPLVSEAGDDRDPAFAAVGDDLAFAYATQSGNPAAGLQISAVSGPYAGLFVLGENPTWSQDGKLLAYDDGHGAIALLDLQTDGTTPISSSGDRDPSWQPAPTECSNGIDDDGDGYVDYPDDPGCTSPSDPSEHADTPGCDDGIDNDGDGLIDMQDPGCPFPQAPIENPPCDDGIDNDGDGLVDMADPMCSKAWPYWEEPPHCGVGAELVLVLGLLRRRMRA
jgi:Tol biopolymer transport system component